MKAWTLSLLLALLSACASTSGPQRHWEAAEAAPAECDEPGADRCTLFLYGVEACALYYCEDVDPSRFVRAQAMTPVRPPAPPPPARPFSAPSPPQRYWGSRQGLPENAEPIFIIPWNETSEEHAARFKKEMEDWPKRIWAKHHVSPQEFKDWFASKGINIHSLTLVIEKEIHQGDRGGPWNAAWRQYIRANGFTANEQAIHLFAVQMLFRFDLSGRTTARSPFPCSPWLKRTSTEHAVLLAGGGFRSSPLVGPSC